jgi:hypothetical protein
MLLSHLFEQKHLSEADIASVNWHTDVSEGSNDAFQQGYERGLKNYRRGPSNPYPPGSEAFADYNDGYQNGEADSHEKYDTSSMNEADSDLQSRLDAIKAELDKTRAAGAAKWQAYKDQQAQEKADYIQQNAASNAEHVKQREEEYQARLKRDREAQEKQDARTKPGYQQRPGASQADNDHIQPHGDTANEIKMFMAGTKPASAIGVMDQPKWQNLIDSGKYVIKQLFGEKGKPGSIVIGQPGEEDRVEKIASLIQGASDRANTGDFSAYHNSNYHRWLGRLLGYPADKIEKFITDYFKDVKDLAKARFDEGDISQLEKDIAAAPVEPIANMESKDKIGGMDADAFDAAMSRLKQLAGSGPLKTVWDPKKRVYRNMPTAVQPKK